MSAEGAATVQAVFAVILVAITGYYAWETRRMAAATARSYELARAQRRDAVLPVLVPRLDRTSNVPPWPHPGSFLVELDNIGVGPALDVVVTASVDEGFPNYRDARLDPPAVGVGRQRSVAVNTAGDRERFGSVTGSIGTLRIDYRDVNGLPLHTTAVLTASRVDDRYSEVVADQVTFGRE